MPPLFSPTRLALFPYSLCHSSSSWCSGTEDFTQYARLHKLVCCSSKQTVHCLHVNNCVYLNDWESERAGEGENERECLCMYPFRDNYSHRADKIKCCKRVMHFCVRVCRCELWLLRLMDYFHYCELGPWFSTFCCYNRVLPVFFHGMLLFPFWSTKCTLQTHNLMSSYLKLSRSSVQSRITQLIEPFAPFCVILNLFRCFGINGD